MAKEMDKMSLEYSAMEENKKANYQSHYRVLIGSEQSDKEANLRRSYLYKSVRS